MADFTTTAPAAVVTTVRVDPDGSATTVLMPVADDGTLRGGIQRALGCQLATNFTIAEQPQTIDGWAPEEAFADTPRNPVARFIIASLADSDCAPIFGPVLFAGADGTTGTPVSLTADVITMIEQLAASGRGDI